MYPNSSSTEHTTSVSIIVSVEAADYQSAGGAAQCRWIIVELELPDAWLPICALAPA